MIELDVHEKKIIDWLYENGGCMRYKELRQKVDEHAIALQTLHNKLKSLLENDAIIKMKQSHKHSTYCINEPYIKEALKTEKQFPFTLKELTGLEFKTFEQEVHFRISLISFYLNLVLESLTVETKTESIEYVAEQFHKRFRSIVNKLGELNPKATVDALNILKSYFQIEAEKYGEKAGWLKLQT